MAKNLQLKTAFWIWLLVFWCSVAYAADNDLAKGLESIPFAAIKYVLIFSFIGGAASTLNKIASPEIEVKKVWVEILKDLFSSLAAGMLVFFLSSWTSLSFWLQAAFITLGGYGGSKFLDAALSNGLFAWADRIFGKVNKDTTP